MKTNEIDKTLAIFIRNNNIRNKMREVTANTTLIQGIIRDYHELLYANKLDNLQEKDKFLEI